MDNQKNGLAILVVGALIFLGLAILVNLFFDYQYDFKYKKDSPLLNQSSKAVPDCNVAVVALHGELVTYIPSDDFESDGRINEDETASDSVYRKVKDAENNSSIKAIVLEVDSSGGSPTAAEEIEAVVRKSTKPVIAYIRSIGTSAAYFAATGADRIFAAESSNIGSIAVNQSYMDRIKSNQQNGYAFHDLSTGKYKNILSEDKPLTDDEKSLVMAGLQATHKWFVRTVAKNRKLDINKVNSIATGWYYNGPEALKIGLIDQVGTLDDVRDYLKNNVLDAADAKLCW